MPDRKTSPLVQIAQTPASSEPSPSWHSLLDQAEQTVTEMAETRTALAAIREILDSLPAEARDTVLQRLTSEYTTTTT